MDAARNAPTVLCSEASHRREPGDEFWELVAAQGWLDSRGDLVLVQAGENVNALRPTVQSLASFMRSRADVSVEVIAPGSHAAEWAPLQVREVVREQDANVVATARPSLLAVPSYWFASHVLVTVAALACDGTQQFNGTLDVQAWPLAALNNIRSRARLVGEAHRLSPSDLAIICAYTGRDSQPLWWAASPSAVRLDMFVAGLAGCEPQSVGALKELARHVVLPTDILMIGSRPRPCPSAVLQGNRAVEACSWLHDEWRAGISESHVIRNNLYRIPHAIRRRLAARLGESRSI